MTAKSLTAAAVSLMLAGCSTLDDAAPAANYDPATAGDSVLSSFYAYDQALPNTPGTLLRQEALQDPQSLDHAGVNLRLLYTSTDGLDGEGAVPVSGVLYLPRGEAPEGGWPLMAWTHGTVGIADTCAPSWNGRQAQDQDYLNLFLKRGYAVVASDYQGLGTKGTHPYLATQPAAYSNLDIIRAVQNGEFQVSEKVVLFGQSQGAAAAIATAGYAANYAPEIDIAGVVATGAPYFTPATVKVLEGLQRPDQPNPMMGYTFLAMTLIEQVDPAFAMRDYITDEVWPIAKRVDDTCYAELKAMVVEKSLTRNQSFKTDPSVPLRSGFARMGYPNLSIKAPLFMGTGGKDRDTPPRMQAGLVRDMCKAGANVRWIRYPELDHRGTVPASHKDTVPFVEAAFAGEAIEGNCANILGS